MADQYGLFFNSVNGDRIYDADSFAEWLNKFFTTGIFNGELEVIADSGMVVDVTPGYANINGKVRFFEQAQAFTLDPASGVYPRIDTIVVRLDTTNRIITTEYVKGEYSGLSPVPTAPVRTNGLYELVLAEIYIGAGATQILSNDITDKRADDSVCGWVTSTVEGVPMDQIVSQMNAQFMTWFEAMKDQLSEDAAGHLQLEIDTLEGALNNLSTTVNNHNLSLGIVENGTTAEQLHRKGQFFVLNGRFCYAKEDIAEGDTFELATNYMYTEIGTQLSELKSGLMDVQNYTLSVPSGWTATNVMCKKVGKFVFLAAMLTSSSGKSDKSFVFSSIMPQEIACPNRISFAAFNNSSDMSLHGIIQGRTISLYRAETTSLTQIEFSVVYSLI